MAQVIAISKHGKLQNSHGGVRFFQAAVGKISEEISDEQAEQFCEMPDHFVRYSGEPIEPPAAGKRAALAPVAKAPSGPPKNTLSAPSADPNF